MVDICRPTEGPVPNGSNLKIMTDRRFVHTGPANRTVNPFPIRSDSGPPKMQVQFGNCFGPKQICHHVNTWTDSFRY